MHSAHPSQFSQELHLVGASEDDRLEYIFGAFYLRESNDQVLNDILGGTTVLLPTTFDLKTSSYALFGNISYTLSDSITATVGLRWSKDSKSMNASIQNGFAFPFTLANVSLDDSFSSLSPKFILDYQIDPDTLIYVSAAQGFKAGGFNGLAVANPAILSVPYEEMSVWSYETGVKLDLFAQTVRLNFAAFLADYDNIQQTAQISGSPLSFAIQNTGSAKVYGLELDFRASPTRTLSLFGQLGLQHDEYGTLTPGSTAALNNAKRIPFTPRVSGQAGFSLDQPVTPTAAFLLGSSVTYSGSYYSAVDNTLLTNSFWRMDGYVGASFYSNYEFRLRVNNLTNEHAVYCCATTNAGVKVLDPRSVTAELSFRF